MSQVPLETTPTPLIKDEGVKCNLTASFGPVNIDIDLAGVVKNMFGEKDAHDD